jgi:hypothetical protein
MEEVFMLKMCASQSKTRADAKDAQGDGLAVKTESKTAAAATSAGEATEV